MVFDAKVWIRTNWPTGLVHEHEVTTNTFAPKRMGCYSIAGLPSAVRMYPFVHIDGERHYQSNLSCPRTQDDNSGQGAKQDHSIGKRVTALTRRPPRLHNCASNCVCLNKYPVTALDIVSCMTLEFTISKN